jgi:Tfp pilus assembly protein PilV
MNSLHRQRGDFLIEAMIGILITAIVSLGMLAISSRVMLTQEEMVRQETIVAVLGDKLRSQRTNQCTATAADRTFALPNRGQVVYSLPHCTATQVNYVLGGKTYTVNLPLIDMTVDVPIKPGIAATYTLGAG